MKIKMTNGMKILIIGDIHFRIITPVSRLEVDMSNVFIDKFNEIKRIASRYKVDLIVCTGDVFHKARSSKETERLAEKCFRILKDYDIVSIVGNHDMIANTMTDIHLTSISLLEDLKSMSHFRVLPDGIAFQDSSLHIKANHYGNNDFVVDKELKKIYENNIVVTHSMITQGYMPYKTTDTEDVETDFDLLISGHNHRTVYHKDDSKVIYNPGALIRLTSEDKDMIRQVEVGIWDVESKQLTRVPILCMNSHKDSFNMELIAERRKVMANRDLSEEASNYLSLEGMFKPVDEVLEMVYMKRDTKDNIKNIVNNYIGGDS